MTNKFKKIAIASGKGGTGKTTVAVNLALHISKLSKLVLCDLDVEEPDSHLFINGTQTNPAQMLYTQKPLVNNELCNGCGVCSEVCNFNAVKVFVSKALVFNELCHSCYACIELCPQKALTAFDDELGELSVINQDKLTFVEAKLQIGKEQAVPLIKKAQNFVDANYPELPVIIDSPPGTSCPVVQVMHYSDYIVLVTEPTPFGLHDLKLAVETARIIGKPFGIVINRDDGAENQTVTYCKQNKFDIIARIPHKQSIASTYASGKAILDTDPDFNNGIKALAEFLGFTEAK